MPLIFTKTFISFRFHGPDQPSGFGFELTLRLKKKDNEDIPPTWPAGLMNKLANYIFQTGKNFNK